MQFCKPIQQPTNTNYFILHMFQTVSEIQFPNNAWTSLKVARSFISQIFKYSNSYSEHDKRYSDYFYFPLYK